MPVRSLLVMVLACLVGCDAPGGDDELGATSSETTGVPETSSEGSETSSEGSETSSETETSGGVECSADVPSEGAALLEWLAGGEYEAWPAESGPHESSGPHFGAVRTFVNPCLFESLDADAATHPLGAVAVKQLYGAGDTVEGYSVMIKVAAGEGGDSWYWYEGYQGNTYADGSGAGLCTGCHGGPGNRDYVLTPWPLQ